MNIIMKNITVESIDEIKDFLQGVGGREFAIKTREERYEIISEVCVKLKYQTLRKRDKSLVKKFLLKVTDYSREQIKRLIKIQKKKGLIYRKPKARGATIPKYSTSDIQRLIETDIAHLTMNGNAVKGVLQRELVVFGKTEYENIAKISVSHIYNIRKNKKQYLSSDAVKYTKTPAAKSDIGERKKPQPDGKPGYLRVDSVHQGDFEGQKGVYHVNIVDEVTQWEVLGCVPQITDEYMEPLLISLLDQFPFEIINFHSDNGKEYINYTVASILERLRISQTKSRSRKSVDQALVEGKNGAIIRKHMGYNYIPQTKASIINNFYLEHMNIYLPYHRLCGFSSDYTDKRGKIRKKYDVYTTPYERLKRIPNAKQYLKEGITFENLDKIAYAMSDNDFGEKMGKARILMKKILKN